MQITIVFVLPPNSINLKDEISNAFVFVRAFYRDEPTSSTVYYSPFYSAHAEKPDTNLGEEREKSPKTEKLFLVFAPKLVLWKLEYILTVNTDTDTLLN